MKYIVLSFDDGTKDFLTNAYPILKRYNIPATWNLISEHIKSKESSVSELDSNSVFWSEVADCMQNGIEIANHSANHTNELEQIIQGKEIICAELETNNRIGFASPHSDICLKNYDRYKILLQNGDVAYIRSGRQFKRDGLFHAFLYLAYKYTHMSKLYYWCNKRNIIHLSEDMPLFFPSVTCNCDNTTEQVINFVKKMPVESASILTFHRIVPKTETNQQIDKWFNYVEDLDSLCRYLSEATDVSVITNFELYCMISKQNK